MDFSGRTVLILGSGGTSLMAKKAVSDRGAQHVYIASRKGGSYPGRADGENETVISYESLPAISRLGGCADKHHSCRYVPRKSSKSRIPCRLPRLPRGDRRDIQSL